MFELMLITNDEKNAVSWEEAGVDIVFVDLERVKKKERQSHLDTFISHHCMDDVSRLRSVLSKCRLLVRLNPLGDYTQMEVDEAIDRGADILMLPMFRSSCEIEEFRDMVAGRCSIYPLIETPEALLDIESLAKLEGISGYHFGLNDLHIAYGMSFMFEVLMKREFQRAVEHFRRNRVFFGIGGVSRVGSGDLPSELIIREHYRLGSRRVILSRTFRCGVAPRARKKEVQAIKSLYRSSPSSDLDANRLLMEKMIKDISMMK